MLTQKEECVAVEAAALPGPRAAAAERVAQQALALLVHVGVQGALAVPHAVARLVQAPVVLTAQAGGGLVTRAGQTGLCAVWGEQHRERLVT